MSILNHQDSDGQTIQAKRELARLESFGIFSGREYVAALAAVQAANLTESNQRTGEEQSRVQASTGAARGDEGEDFESVIAKKRQDAREASYHQSAAPVADQEHEDGEDEDALIDRLRRDARAASYGGAAPAPRPRKDAAPEGRAQPVGAVVPPVPVAPLAPKNGDDLAIMQLEARLDTLQECNAPAHLINDTRATLDAVRAGMSAAAARPPAPTRPTNDCDHAGSCHGKGPCKVDRLDATGNQVIPGQACGR